MPRAMSDVESPLATRAATLTSVGVSASQPEVARGPGRPRPPRLMPCGRSRDRGGQPLVDKGPLIFKPRDQPGQAQHGLTGLPALLQGQRVGGDQEVLVLPVHEILDGQGQPVPKMLVSGGALFPAPGY